MAACHAKGISPADVVVSMRLTWTRSVEIDANPGAPLLFFKVRHVGCLLFGGADWLHQRRNLFKPHRQVEEKILLFVEPPSHGSAGQIRPLRSFCPPALINVIRCNRIKCNQRPASALYPFGFCRIQSNHQSGALCPPNGR